VPDPIRRKPCNRLCILRRINNLPSDGSGLSRAVAGDDSVCQPTSPPMEHCTRGARSALSPPTPYLPSGTDLPRLLSGAPCSSVREADASVAHGSPPTILPLVRKPALVRSSTIRTCKRSQVSSASSRHNARRHDCVHEPSNQLSRQIVFSLGL